MEKTKMETKVKEKKKSIAPKVAFTIVTAVVVLWAYLSYAKDNAFAMTIMQQQSAQLGLISGLLFAGFLMLVAVYWRMK
jgi:polyferredoxin